MYKVPNQKVIECKRQPVRYEKGGKPILAVYWDSVARAAQDLNECGFKLYLLLVRNIEYSMSFSPRYVAMEMGMNEDSARNALRELENKGYVRLKAGTKATYQFFEEPLEQVLPPQVNTHPFKIQEDDGTITDYGMINEATVRFLIETRLGYSGEKLEAETEDWRNDCYA